MTPVDLSGCVVSPVSPLPFPASPSRAFTLLYFISFKKTVCIHINHLQINKEMSAPDLAEKLISICSPVLYHFIYLCLFRATLCILRFEREGSGASPDPVRKKHPSEPCGSSDPRQTSAPPRIIMGCTRRWQYPRRRSRSEDGVIIHIVGYHTVVMLTRLFLHANILFCLNK